MVLNKVEWSDSRPGRFNPCKRASDTLWARLWLGPKASGHLGGENNLKPAPGIEKNFSVAQPVADLLYNYSILAPVFNCTELRFKFLKIVQEYRVVSSVRGVHGIQEYHIRRHIFTKTEVRAVRKALTLNFIASTCAKTSLFAFTKFPS